MYLTAFKQKSVQVNKNLEAKVKDKGKIEGNISSQYKRARIQQKKCSCVTIVYRK